MKSLKKVEKIMAKGEIARFEQFLLLSQCFQKSSAVDASKCMYRLERVNSFLHPFSSINAHQCLFKLLCEKENINYKITFPYYAKGYNSNCEYF